MKKMVKIFNIPNYYCSYYLLGFYSLYNLKFVNNKVYSKYNNKPYLIVEIENKIIIIDNNDPVRVDDFLLKSCDFYFATNKLLNNFQYKQDKIHPLYPHYPINCLGVYIKVFKLHLFHTKSILTIFKQLYHIYQRPVYKNYNNRYQFNNFVFFNSRVWKNEIIANELRAHFIKICKSDNRINFRGGFVSRTDGNNFGYDSLINKESISPKDFGNLSRNSLFVFNNPAVLNAVSWRLAEYLNYGRFVISTPFMIELPKPLENLENIFMLNEIQDLEEAIDFIFENKEKHKIISQNAKLYFNEYCTPIKQVEYVLNVILSK